MEPAFLITFCFSAAFTALVCYALAMGRTVEPARAARLALIGRTAFYATVASFIAASVVLMVLIFTHRFEYVYVHEHSGRSLSVPLLFASFYAGQEGSFMLWTLMVSLIGVAVLGYARRAGYEAHVMAPLALVMSCLLVILIVKSPFTTVWALVPDQALPSDVVQSATRGVLANGKGLNPQLENLWITIHPPMLFLGFASMTVPFVFAVAALLKRDYQRWITISLPWVLFACAVLGFGIMLGGWWAYETLGWGGFWAWDPVENSSLIPWLACVALAHSMLVQKRTGAADGSRVGGLVKTNFVLATLAFGLILYSTFLTRSGVLGETSVHSFVAPGMFVYAVLLAIIALFMGLGFGALALRWRELRQSPFNFPLTSRESALAIGSGVLLASALVVLIGTSWPIITPLFDQPKVAVEQAFYNNLHIPIAIALALVNAASMRLKWKATEGRDFWGKMVLPAVIAAAGTVGVALLGIDRPLDLVLAFGALLALVVNVQVGARIVRGKPGFIGAYVSHAGVALLLIGVLVVSRSSQIAHVMLPQGETREVFGYRVSYVGSERVDLEKKDREKFRHAIKLERDGESTMVYPVTFLSDFNNREQAFMEPDIVYHSFNDIYIAPKAIEQLGGDPTVTVRKGEEVRVPFDSSIALRFDRFDMNRAASDGLQGMVMEVRTRDTTATLTSYRRLSDGMTLPVSIPGTDIRAAFSDLQVDRQELGNSRAQLTFTSLSHPPAPTQVAVSLDLSIKPLIKLVWVGVVIMTIGFLVALFRRRREAEPYLRHVEVAPAEVEPRAPESELGLETRG